MANTMYVPTVIPNVSIGTASKLPPSRNPALVYIASLASGSRRTMRSSLQTIVDILLGYDPRLPDSNPNRTLVQDGTSAPIVTWIEFPWQQLEYQHTAAIRAVVVSHYKKRTSVKMLSAMRRVLKECWRLGYISVETYHRAIDLERISGEPLSQAQTGRHIAYSEIVAVLHACADGTLAGVRDAAIVATAYNCGLRRGELAALRMAHLNIDERSLRIIGGKGDKERLVFMGSSGMTYLQAWLRERGVQEGAVFGAISKGGKLRFVTEGSNSIPLVPNMTDQAIYNILKRRAKMATLEDFSPHDIRRTFAGNLLDAGVDLATVQKLMGHSDPGTTAGYDRRSEQVKKDAVERLTLPILDEIMHYTK